MRHHKTWLIYFVLLASSLMALDIKQYQTLLARNPKHRDVTMVMPVGEIQKKWKAQKVHLVDIRSEVEYKKYHIPGSLNIPIRFIHTKTFLKSKPIVLVYRGLKHKYLETQCQKLKEQGFMTSLMEGGLLGWKTSGGELYGNPLHHQQLSHISPLELFLEKDYTNHLIINVSQTPSKLSTFFFPYAHHIPFNDEFIPNLQSFIEEHQTTPFLTITLFTHQGENYHQIQKILKSQKFKHIYYLTGGLKAFQTFLHHHQLSTRSRDSRLRRQQNCPTCPQKTTTQKENNQ